MKVTSYNSVNIFLMNLFLLTSIGCGDEKEPVPAEDPVENEVTAVAAEEDQEETEWNYENTDWAALGNNDCATAVQSPVNIETEEAIRAALPPISYDYQPFEMSIVDNGHSVQVAGSQESALSIEGINYEFVQMHFHAPSEHTLNDRRFPLEVHLVHREVGTENLLVLGVFVEEGIENLYLEDVFAEIPEQKKEEVVTEVSIDLNNYIPDREDYYTYIGSLTTPPCTVGVKWIVFDQAISASAAQIKEFTSLYDNTARPVQSLNNRNVYTTMNMK